MRLFALKFYPAYLLFSSFILMAFILAGSHGKLILDNPDTLKGIVIIAIFITTAILIYLKNKVKSYLKIVFCLSALCILIYLTSTLFYPAVFTLLSSLFFLLQVFGILCGLITIYTVIKK